MSEVGFQELYKRLQWYVIHDGEGFTGIDTLFTDGVSIGLYSPLEAGKLPKHFIKEIPATYKMTSVLVEGSNKWWKHTWVVEDITNE